MRPVSPVNDANRTASGSANQGRWKATADHAISATPPDVLLNGKPDRLSPGSRIRDTNNMLVLSGALAGKSVYTVYRRDSAGLIHEVWLLTAAEYEKLGGPGAADGDGVKRFYELLNLIWAARALAGLK